MSNRSKIFLTLILAIFSISYPTMAIDLDGELTTELNYAKVDDQLPDFIKKELELDANSYLNLNLSGLYNGFQYNLRLKGDANNYNLDLQNA